MVVVGLFFFFPLINIVVITVIKNFNLVCLDQSVVRMDLLFCL